MANWYYYDASGQKQGPLRGRDLSALAKNGTITPETVVENEQGQRGKAGQIKELVFASSAASPVSQENVGVYGVKAEPAKPKPVPPPITRQPVQNVLPPIPSPTTQPVAVTAQGSFCTYCGQPVHPTAAACMACGANPRVHRKFCCSCGIPINEVQVICTKCHTPVGGNGENTGVGGVPAGQVPGLFAAPVQSVAQPQPYASAQLVIDRPLKFMFQTSSFDVLINGQKVGEVANGKNIEISAPTGSVKLEMRTPAVRVITPVTMNLAAGQKKKIILRLKKYYVLQSLFTVILSLIFGLMMAVFFKFDFSADLTAVVVAMLFALPPVVIYVQTAPAYVIEQEV